MFHRDRPWQENTKSQPHTWLRQCGDSGRYCQRLKPRLAEAAQAEVAEKYVDMRMRFQSGFAEQQNPDGNKKPKLAVTTRTLEALGDGSGTPTLQKQLLFKICGVLAKPVVLTSLCVVLCHGEWGF